MQTIEDWLDELRAEKKIIIVEGPKDKSALEHFGITGVVTLSRYPLYKIIEQVAATCSQAIILTDFDRKGRQLYGRLSSGLQRLGVGIDRKYREFLSTQRLSHVEGIRRFVENADRLHRKA